MVAQRNPATKIDMNMSKYVDESTLDELEKEGSSRKSPGNNPFKQFNSFKTFKPCRRFKGSYFSALNV